MNRDDTPFRLSYPIGFLVRAAAASVLACGAGLTILRWIFWRDLGTEYAAAFYTLKNLLDFLVPALVFCLLSVLLLASLAVFVVALFASHKVAGPLFRLQRVAGHLAGRVLVGRVHLRLGDQGKPVASELNAWVSGRKERLARLRVGAEAWEAALGELERAVAGGTPEALSEALRILKHRTGELAEEYP